MDPADNVELLTRHAPVLRFEGRELFFPTAVESFVSACSVIVAGDERLAPGEVNVDVLDQHLGADACLRFVSDVDRRAVVKEEAARLARKLFGPRLGRVGLFGRILDAVFRLSVLVRPTTPPLTAVAAKLKAEALGLHRQPTCYARIIEVADWLVLHYTFFYVMNDWRSGYRGLNDHEGDWEQAWIFCDPADRQPVWVVGSSHENEGADLRRHWADTELQRIDDRPVFYVGAGSHALFFRPGDYVSRIDVPALRPLIRVRTWVRRALRIRDETEPGLGPAVGAPFVDAATGDGRQIEEWNLEPLDEHRGCFGRYRGLWGLDTGDPIHIERGPAGPKFGRNGRIRASWADPVGFAGLHGTSPPSMADPESSLDNIALALAEIDDEVRRVLRVVSLTAQVGEPEELRSRASRLGSLLRQQNELRDLRNQIEQGDLPGRNIRAHLRDPAVPLALPRESGWLLALWATVSVPLVMLSIAAPLLLSNLRVLGPLLGLAAGFSLLEQLVRRHFSAALRLAGLYVLIALLFGFVSVVTVSLYAVGAVLAVAGVLLLVANLGELTAYRRRAESRDPQI
jgi:hypothetical protein